MSQESNPLEYPRQKAEKAIPLVLEIVTKFTRQDSNTVTGIPNWDNFFSTEDIQKSREIIVEGDIPDEGFKFTWNPWSLVLRVTKTKVSNTNSLIKLDKENQIRGGVYAEDRSEAIFDLANKIS